MKINLIILSSFLFAGCYCNHFSAGNLVSLSYPVNSRLKIELVQQYLDTLIQKKGFGVPTKWRNYDKLVDIDSLKNKRIYFKDPPEEMYLISLQGQIILNDVFNPNIKQNDWIADRKLMSKIEEKRVVVRFTTQILSQIEQMAKRDGLPDTLIYY